MRRYGRLLMLGAMLLCMTTPARAETRALLVAVGDYTSSLIPDLKGPGNDAVAMEALLRADGAKDITVLRDDAATRTGIETAIHALGIRAQPGDWLVVYFSGHGAQAQAAVKGDEDDDLDEFLVLGGFDMKNPTPESYITDNDFRAWFARYVPPSVQVLHIADACHSGTLNRSIDPRAWTFTPRLAFTGRSAAPQLARPAPQFESVLGGGGQGAAIGGESYDLPNVIFIGAAQDDQLALEAALPVEGAPSRGLLTYSIEEALSVFAADGKTRVADLDLDGAISVEELAAYIDSQTRMLTGQRQQPTTHFKGGREKDILFQKAVAAPAPPVVRKPQVFATRPQELALLAGIPEWEPAARANQADFVWDRPSGIVLRRSGDIVAREVEAVEALKGVVEKWNAVEALRPLISEATTRVVIGPLAGGARYKPGAKVELQVVATAGAESYVTVFNLASDGRVQLLYPLAEDGEGRLPKGGGTLPVLDTEVVAPYGADHVVALVTAQPPEVLRRLLKSVDDSRAAARVTPVLKDELARGGGKASLSIGELYTGS